MLSAAKNGMQTEVVERLQQLVLDTHTGVLQRDSSNDPLADVEPTRVGRKPGATAMQPRPYPPTKVAWLEDPIGETRARSCGRGGSV